MQKIFTNQNKIPLSLAVWLAEDKYEYRPNAISVTTLLKSTRQIILNKRVMLTETIPLDISNLVASSMGTAIHDSIHSAWEHNYKKSLKSLGYPDSVIEAIKINPDKSTLKPNDIPVYLEQRHEKDLNGTLITGEYDFVGDGILDDFKSTGVYTYMTGNNTEKYKLQGSMYRWLSPDIITSDYMNIQFVFTDWSKLRSIVEKAKGYPQQKVQSIKIPLMSYKDIETWMAEKIMHIQSCENLDEKDITPCTDKDLWRSESVFKYYKNPNSTQRSTRNFDTYHEAFTQYTDDGSVGIIKEVKGQVKACLYCNGFSICTQKDLYVADGSLVV